MKVLKMLTLAASLLAFGIAKAQTADDIINRYVDSLGGKAKLAALNSAIYYGNLDYQGSFLPATIYRVQNKGYKFVVDADGSSNYVMVTDKGMWTFIPSQGQASPQAAPAEQAKLSMPNLDLQSALFNYKQKGSKVESAGKDSVDGRAVNKIRLTNKDGLLTTYFIDAETYKLLKTRVTITDNGQSVDVDRKFSDYRRVDGILFPFRFDNQYGNVIIDRVEVNKPIEDKVFSN